jgi:hypothetical protein
MTLRFKPSHRFIIDYLFDRRWHSRANLEKVVMERFFARHVNNPLTSGVVPKKGRWRSGITTSLMWMATNGWINVRRRKDGVEEFQIDKAKRSHFRNVMEARARDAAEGRTHPNGVYKKGMPCRPKSPAVLKLNEYTRLKHGNDRKEPGKSL